MSAWDDPVAHIRGLEAEVERLRGKHAEAEWLLRMSENARDRAERKAEAAEALAEEWTAIWDNPPRKWRYIALRTVPSLTYARAVDDLRAALETP